MSIPTEFFILLGLQSRLRYIGYDRLDLEYLDTLRAEVDRKVDEYVAKDKAKKEKER